MKVETQQIDLKNLHTIPNVPNAINKEFKALAKRNYKTKAVKNEGEQISQNLKNAEVVTFPKDFKSLYLLAQDTYDDMENRRKYFDIKGNWIEQHEALSVDKGDVKTKVLKGDHLLYLTAYKEMAKEIEDFISANK